MTMMQEFSAGVTWKRKPAIEAGDDSAVQSPVSCRTKLFKDDKV